MNPAMLNAMGSIAQGLGSAVAGGPNVSGATAGFDNSNFSVATGGSKVKATAEKTSTMENAMDGAYTSWIIGALILGGLIYFKRKK